MITNSDYEPHCYQVTKVQEMVPQGVIKITVKQDDFNENRDNPQLRICDYYTDEGNLLVNIDPAQKPRDIAKFTSTISRQEKNENGELVEMTEQSNLLDKGTASYFVVTFMKGNKLDRVDPEWKVTMIDDQDYTQDEIKYYTNLLSVTEFDDSVVAIKPGKAGSLSGKKFRLSVSDKNGNYYSSIDLEVV